MRESKVPIDMSSEQKNLMGVLSSRQAIYVGIGAALIYTYTVPVFKISSMLFGWIAALIICLILALPIVAIVVVFGFMPVSKFNMSRDLYVYLYLQRGTNLGIWRKGNSE